MFILRNPLPLLESHGPFGGGIASSRCLLARLRNVNDACRGPPHPPPARAEPSRAGGSSGIRPRPRPRNAASLPAGGGGGGKSPASPTARTRRAAAARSTSIACPPEPGPSPGASERKVRRGGKGLTAGSGRTPVPSRLLDSGGFLRGGTEGALIASLPPSLPPLNYGFQRRQKTALEGGGGGGGLSRLFLWLRIFEEKYFHECLVLHTPAQCH